MSDKTETEDSLFDWINMVLNPKSAGYQTIQNIGTLLTFGYTVVPAIPTNTYDIDITIDDGTVNTLAVALLNTDTWGAIAAKIQAALQTATGSTELVFIWNGLIRVVSATTGPTSTVLIAAGTAGSAGGDLLTAIDALGTLYQTTLNTPKIGANTTPEVPIIWADENGPIPDSAYVMLRVIANPQLDMPMESQIKVPADPQEPPYQEIRTENELTLSIQGYGYASQEYLDALHESLGFPSIQEYLDSQFLAVRDYGTVTNISEILDDRNEKRFSLEVMFGVAIMSTDDGDGEGRPFIETVQWSGTYPT